MTLRVPLLCVFLLSALTPAFAQPDYQRSGPPPPRDRVYEPLREDRITLIYEDTLGRLPSRNELRECRERAQREQWGEDDVRNDLRRGREYHQMTPEVVIQRAYRDLLGHEPDPQSMRNYRRRMVEQNWSPGQLRQAILESDEYQIRRVDIMIERAYDDYLERKPDPQGRERYRKLIREGMTEQQLRDRLRQSEEHRVTLPDSKTKHAFHEVLGHDPDPHSMEVYRKRLVDDGWTEDRIKDELRRTPEYQSRKKK